MSPIIVFLLLAIILSSPSVSADNCSEDDKKVLQLFKDRLKLNTYPDLSQVTCCCCDLDDRIQCDAPTGRITYLEVTLKSDPFTIPPVLTKLPLLRGLTFHKNPGLAGPIPSFLAKMTNLTSLTLSWNSLTGPVPDFLAPLVNLNYLDLSFNRLTGAIPSSLGSLPQLGWLDISRNRLTGSIPDSLGPSPVTNLFLSHNGLTGAMPRSFAGKRFDVVDVSWNRLSGDASHVLGSSRSLYLSRNRFEFNMSGAVFEQGVAVLSVEHNRIYGSLPGQLAGLDLFTFNVSYNRLCGRIPSGNWSEGFDEYSFFHNKCLCGAPLAPCE